MSKREKIALVIIIVGSIVFAYGTYLNFFKKDSNVSFNTYKVSLDASGGSVKPDYISVSEDSTYGELPVPKKNGYTFDGWFSEKENGKKITKDTKIIANKNHVLYARWTFDIYDLDPIVSVNNTSTKNNDYFGGLYSSTKYGETYVSYNGDNSIYTDNGGALQFDNDGALILDENNAIAVLDIDSKYNINDNYSVSVTFDGDISQGGESGDDHANTIAAISQNFGNYLCWIGVYKNYVHVFSYIATSPENGVNRPYSTRGFASFDISDFNNSIINLQVVGTRDRKTVVYANGEVLGEFASGAEKFNVRHLTLGDLRLGRNLKFKGKIYEFAIFDKTLTKNQVKSNFENSKANKK